LRALTWLGGDRLELTDEADAEPGAEETVVEVNMCGVCGSDLHPLRGHAGPRTPPLVLGHELVGTVSGREGRFVAFPLVSCGACRSCRDGLEPLCENRGLLGLDRPGALAEQVVVRADALMRVPDGLDDARAVLAEPLATAVSALRLEGVADQTDLVVIGCGPIGLLSVFAAARIGARVRAVEPLDSRRAIAGELGASTLHPSVHDLESGTADVVIDAVGAEETLAGGLAVLRPGGRLAVVGLAASSAELPVGDVVRRGLHMRGHYAYTREDFAEALELLADPALTVDWVRMRPLEESPRAVADLLDHPETTTKLVISMKDRVTHKEVP
jgi:threonine dehydrogenase-like Zn-dependent dehydrogenase